MTLPPLGYDQCIEPCDPLDKPRSGAAGRIPTMPNHGRRPNQDLTRQEEFPAKDDRTMRCPDCEDNSSGNRTENDMLDHLGKARFNRALGIPRSLGCETCKGTGRIPALPIDLMERPK